jgi:C2 domain
MDCFQFLAHLPRMHSILDWIDKTDDSDDNENNIGEESRDLAVTHVVPDVVVEVARERILMEIVGAMGLESKQRRTVDPYCTVQVYDSKQNGLKMIHRTDTIPNDGNPIWTAKTKSLCLVEVPVIAAPQSEEEDDIKTSVVIDLYHASKRLGRVCVPFTEVLRLGSTAERVEFTVKAGPEDHSILGSGVLALRFRFATEQDLVFLHKLSQKRSAVREHAKTSVITPNQADTALLASPGDVRKVAADINFQSVQSKSILQRYQKTDNDGRELFRIIPYPDPDRPNTEFMSANDIEHTAYQPSTKWVTAGCGSLGTLYVEVIGCDKLPQKDYDLSLTDAFVAMAFEDNFLRTDIIWDHFSPRWMPWTTRAFQFSVRHPASLLCLSVFDFDETPLNMHDPIGRVVLRPSNFRGDMTYTLHYPLRDDPSEQSLPDTSVNGENASLSAKSTRGTIILRLCMKWEDEGEAMKLYFAPPPRFIINVDNVKSYNVLCYTTRGAVYMDEASLKSVKVLANEILSYGKNLCLALDATMETLLWRGRWQVAASKSIWFPIHSVALFVAAVIVIERPNLTGPVLLYAFAWVLLSINYQASHHPNPWLRVPSSRETNTWMIFGRRHVFSSSEGGTRPTEIVPNQGVVQSAQHEKLDALKAARMSALIHAALTFALKVYRIYKKTSDYGVKITTESRNWDFLSGRLYYVHYLLLLICQGLRFGRNFLSWQSNYTAVFTTNCIMLATAWLIFPTSTILRWLLRILVWAILGPWMKLVDVKYFLPWYATKEELLERIQNGTADKEPNLPDFDSVLESENFLKLIHSGRVKAEELYKLRDMRTLLFGSYSEAVPFSDNSRYPSVPLPQSTAVRTEWIDPPRDTARGYHVPGQLLTGNMIPARPKQVAHNQGDEKENESEYNPHSEGKKTN